MFALLWNGDKCYFPGRESALAWVLEQFGYAVSCAFTIEESYYLSSPPLPPDMIRVVLGDGTRSDVSALIYPGAKF